MSNDDDILCYSSDESIEVKKQNTKNKPAISNTKVIEKTDYLGYLNNHASGTDDESNPNYVDDDNEMISDSCIVVSRATPKKKASSIFSSSSSSKDSEMSPKIGLEDIKNVNGEDNKQNHIDKYYGYEADSFCVSSDRSMEWYSDSSQS